MRLNSVIGGHIVPFMLLMLATTGVNAATVQLLGPASSSSVSFVDNLVAAHGLTGDVHVSPPDAKAVSWLDAAQFNPFTAPRLATPSFDELAAHANHRGYRVGYSVGGSPHLSTAGGDTWLMVLVGVGLVAYQLRRKQRYLQPTPFAS